jgi:hypothetical protein
MTKELENETDADGKKKKKKQAESRGFDRNNEADIKRKAKNDLSK